MSRDLDRVANEFKPDATAIAEAPVPVSANAALYVVLTLLVAAIVWAVVGKVDRIVVAPGKVATSTPMLVMQPFTTSRVVEIAVKAGDRVRKGQLLARFDPAFASADVASLQQKVVSLTAQAARLEAQLTGGTFSATAEDGPDRYSQAQIFVQEMNDYRASVNQRESRLSQIESQLQVANEAVPGIQRQLGMASQVVEIQERLQRRDRLTVASSRGVELVPIVDIIAVVGADDYVELRLTGGRCLLHAARLDRLETELPTGFLRVHRSVIANLALATGYARDGGRWTLLMQDGAALPISRRRLPALRETLGEGAPNGEPA